MTSEAIRKFFENAPGLTSALLGISEALSWVVEVPMRWMFAIRDFIANSRDKPE